ncbi:zonular occludens toxin domain-containing protein [Thiomicrorhabdus sp.]|uniref:zonular occludens toxin domain-containing protein n=1 Tax=Thiomicrorhabdus sp. TaxID=2039724 RepID=UPI0029C7E878|nr:zonular occludens toxin domain-containing protein [Thiomicrorhabdus sp.]
MITLTTGLPGNYKTFYRLVQTAAEQSEQEKQTGKRPNVYLVNFQLFTQKDFENKKCSQSAVGKPLDPEHPKFSDFSDWEYLELKDLTDDIWLLYEDKHPNIEQGSIIVVDECQDIYPTRVASKKLPTYIQFFEKHRHTGCNFHLITQAPRQIDIHVRELVNFHYELDRHGKLEASNVSISSKGLLENCPDDLKKKELFKAPKEYYGVYKSASEHTQTASIWGYIKDLPIKVKAIILVFFGFLAFSIYQLFINEGGLSMFSDTPPAETQQPSQDSPIQQPKQVSPLGLNASGGDREAAVPQIYLTHFISSGGVDAPLFTLVNPDGSSLNLTKLDLINLGFDFKSLRPGVYLLNGKLIPNIPFTQGEKKDEK